MNRRLLFILAIIYCGAFYETCVPAQCYAQQAEGVVPEVKLEDLITIMQEAESRMTSFRVECKSTSKTEFYDSTGVRKRGMADGAIGKRQTVDATWYFQQPGKLRCTAEISATSVLASGSHKKGRTRFRSVFDAQKGEGKYLLLDSDEKHAEEQRRKFYVFVDRNPLVFIRLNQGRAVSKVIDHHSSIDARNENVDGRPTIVVSTSESESRPSHFSQTRFWVDLERRVTVRRQMFSRASSDQPWVLQQDMECSEFEHQPSCDLWVPTAAKLIEWVVTEQGESKLNFAAQYRFTNWSINEKLDDSLFSLEVPLDSK